MSCKTEPAPEPRRWDQDLDKAITNGIDSHTQSILTDRAGSWGTCAVGECLADMKIYAVCSVLQRDKDLESMGSAFTGWIYEGNWELAKRTYGQIKKRLDERRAELESYKGKPDDPYAMVH